MKQRSIKGTITKYLVTATSILVLFILVFAKAGVAISNTSDSNAEAIVIEGNNVIIQGDTTATNIRGAIQNIDSGVDTVLFKNQIAITTDQPSDQGPFQNATWLKYIKAGDGAQVSFKAAAGQTDPTLKYFFYGCTNLVSLDGLSVWDVSNVTGDFSMAVLFSGCSSLTSLDALSAWNVSKVTGVSCMNSMFQNCFSLASLDGLSAWDVSGVTGVSCMAFMFTACSSLTSLDGLSSWNVLSVKGEYCMYSMFKDCSDLTSLDGLSAWNVSGVTGDSCMRAMFSGCSCLASLDGLSAWDVSSVKGVSCMSSMFYNCDNLQSVDALSNWNIQNVVDSTKSPNGTKFMLSKKSGKTIASITVSSTFTLSDDMFVDSDSGKIPSANWWPVNDTSATQGIDTAELVTQSTSTSPSSLRWQRCTSGASNPMTPITNLSVTWPTSTTLSYTGLLQTISASVTADSTTALTEGKDFYITYSNASSNISDAIKDVGSYTATLHIRGAYTYSGSLPTTTVAINTLDLNRTTNPVSVYTVPSVFSYTGSAITPKTMIRLNIGDDIKPLYTYLVENTATRSTGDYTVFYKNNIRPGIAKAIVNPATPAGLTAPNIEGSLTATFQIIGDGWQQDEYGWRYVVNGNYLNDGWHFFEDEFGNHWYYFNKDSYIATSQWIWDNNWQGWYWLCSTGPMIESLWQWIDNAWYGFWYGGKMCQGWVWDSNYKAWYYCFNNGVVALNTWIGPYRIDASGKWIH